MTSTASNLLRSLPPMVAGLLLGLAGWFGAAYQSPETGDFRPQLVVRPASAQIITRQGKAPVADDNLAGRFLFDEAGFDLEIRPKGWPSSQSKIDEPRGMTTVRSTMPLATLAVTVKDDKSAKAKLVELPKKTKLKAMQGKVTLDPGRHELLVQADGYLPKRLSVNLKPGEARVVAMDLEAIPGFPPTGFPAGLSIPPNPGAGISPNARPPASYVPPAYVPPPRYQAPPTYDPPAPVPRFTPIAPPPQPAGPDPVPMFTPIGN
jgi:hypothetical protein